MFIIFNHQPFKAVINYLIALIMLTHDIPSPFPRFLKLYLAIVIVLVIKIYYLLKSFK